MAKCNTILKKSRVFFMKGNKASAKDGVGAGRGPCGLRNSELGPLPHDFSKFALEK